MLVLPLKHHHGKNENSKHDKHIYICNAPQVINDEAFAMIDLHPERRFQRGNHKCQAAMQQTDSGTFACCHIKTCISRICGSQVLGQFSSTYHSQFLGSPNLTKLSQASDEKTREEHVISLCQFNLFMGLLSMEISESVEYRVESG